jgi:cystathionine beta-lyase
MSKIVGLNRRSFLKSAGMTALAGAVGTGGAAAGASPETPPYLVNGKYDFDTIYNRIGTDCVKWDSQISTFGDKVKIGMGIADTDFRAAPCIGEAMAARLQHENWGYLSGEAMAAFRETIAEWNLDRY